MLREARDSCRITLIETTTPSLLSSEALVFDLEDAIAAAKTPGDMAKSDVRRGKSESGGVDACFHLLAVCARLTFRR